MCRRSSTATSTAFSDAYLHWRRANALTRFGSGNALAKGASTSNLRRERRCVDAAAPPRAARRRCRMIRVEDVAKVYDGGTAALQGCDAQHPQGRIRLPGGSVRVGQVDAHPPDAAPGVAQPTATSGLPASTSTELPSWKVPLLRRSVGTVFQDFKLLPNKTVFENVAFALEVIGRPRHVVQSQVPQVLRLVGLAAKADRLPRQLSGGEQQRVSIARAFVNRPLILLADEPTGNLDPATSVGIMRLLDRINRTGTTVVMATHDHAIVDAMRRRVIALERGAVVRDQSRGAYETGEEPAES